MDRFAGAYESTPPWDIGRPQPAIERVAEAGGLAGRVLDAGCGTGEHAMMAARLGFDATGIDGEERAIEIARSKAQRRGLAVRFLVGDVLHLEDLGGPFDTVIDCGCFHTFDDAERSAYVRSLAAVVPEGGSYLMLCFSDRQPGVMGPRRVTEQEIMDAFADGWDVRSIVPAILATNVPDRGDVQAWLASITRLAG